MATTGDVTVHDNGWTTLATGSASVTLQLKSRGKVSIYIGTAPPAGETADGILLWSEGETVFSGNALAGADNVYARSHDGDVTIAVMAT